MRENGEYSLEEFKNIKKEIENQITTYNISLHETRIEQFDMEATLTYSAKVPKACFSCWNTLHKRKRIWNH